jgi:asparagine synthase (glutamine-hydrolysing)
VNSMAELVGVWLGQQRHESGIGLLSDMAATLRPGPTTDRSVGNGSFGLLVRPTTGPLDLAADDTCYAVMLGHVRWSDPQIEDIARASGPAAALREAYRRFDDELFAHLHGEFALCVVDLQRRTVVLAVDRFCTYSLAYAVTPDGDLVFGTSSRAVSASRLVGARIAPASLYQYLFFNIVPTPHSIFAGVTTLQPGNRLRFAADRAQVRRYFRPAFTRAKAPSMRVLGDELHTALERAVARCRPDAATGAFLSGGLDSSTVAGLLHRLGTRPARTFSIGFDVPGFDELEYARSVARHFGTQQHEYYVTADDVARAAEPVARAYDEPFGNSSAIAVYLCARLAAERGIGTLFAGDGGDEIFGGNARYSKQLIFAAYWKLPPALRTRVMEGVLLAPWMPRRVPLLSKLQSYIEQARLPMPDRLESYNLFHREGAQRILHPDFVCQVDLSQPVADLRSWYAAVESEDFVDRLLGLDWKLTLADNDLRKVGRMCELAGVDVRYPMLDEDLFDIALRLPARYKVRPFELRWFYRRALRGFLPESTIRKRKHGFGLPFGLWMRDHAPLRTLVMDCLADMRQRRIIDPGFIDLVVSRHATDHATYYGTFIWTILMLELWLRNRSPAPAGPVF